MDQSVSKLSEVKLETSFQDQKPGTSGLRKSSQQFAQENYLESFIESIFQTLPGVFGGVLILGGDGRYGNKRAIDVIIRMAAAHGVSKIITGINGIISTPAASHLIRTREAIGGIILSASHNMGGENGDFGVKINADNGGPASEVLTEAIYKCTKTLEKYKIAEASPIPIDIKGIYSIGDMSIEVLDGVDDYIDLMKSIFQFDLIKSLLASNFPIAFDAMNAVTGPYAKRLFEDLLEAPSNTVRNFIPLEDFGGMHPDPNLTYAKDLAYLLLNGDEYSFGAACDGDGDRNMVLGQRCFVNPSDSLAILVANYSCVPGYKNGLSGVARSMPTSSAVDVVAKELDIPCYETPTGWKFFGNLLDAGKITLCGEESFGTGSNHIREKDGLWAILFWLQILSVKKCSVSQVMRDHWNRFGRHYYSRHDYESIPSDIANQIYKKVELTLPAMIGTSFADGIVQTADNFSYLDPIDHSITNNQGLRIILDNGNRVILRLSGTGTQGATIRVYFESYVPPSGKLDQDPQEALSLLISGIEKLAEIKLLSGMSRPTVIT